MGFKSWLRSPRYKRYKFVISSIFLLGVALNAIAWMQARAMTHYVASGERTAKPEDLSSIDKIGVILTGVRRDRPVNHRTPQDIGLSYETHQIALPYGEKLETWFIPARNSRGVFLLFPPYGASKQALLAPSKILHELGYDTLLVDFRGVGGSTGSDTTLGVREAKDVALAVSYVRQKWSGRPLFLYGASMGAAAVMRAIAFEGVTPTAIILESPFDRLLNMVRHRFEAMGIPSFPSAELILWWGGWQQNIDAFAHNPIDYAKEINCPVLLMYGEYDKRVTSREIESILDTLPKRKQLVVFSALGHGSLAGEDSPKWKRQVREFLSR